MKELYLAEAKNDSIFTFVGDLKTSILVGAMVAVLTLFIVLMICKKRKDDKM